MPHMSGSFGQPCLRPCGAIVEPSPMNAPSPTRTGDHFVTVGRREDGTAYTYNPDPPKGDSTVFTCGKGASRAPTS